MVTPNVFPALKFGSNSPRWHKMPNYKKPYDDDGINSYFTEGQQE